MKSTFALPAALLLLTACIDGTGPRPRPTGIEREPPPAESVIQWYETQPRIITHGQTDTVQVTVAVQGQPDAVGLDLRTGSFVQLTRSGDGLFTGKIAASQLLFGYRLGDGHFATGFIEVTNGTRTIEHIMFVNVRDAMMPNVTPQVLGAGIQATTRVANIRFDSLFVGKQVPPAVLRTFYNSFSDDFHFAVVIEQVHSDNQPSLLGVRNQIRGLGLPLFDNGATYGSAATLEAIVQFPGARLFDLAATGTLHEFGHRWMNHSNHPLLVPGKPHWPLSSIAYGIMGWTDPATSDALIFGFSLVELADGTFQLRTADVPRLYNDLELYMMGLLPPDSVGAHIVFADQNQRAQVRPNGILRGRVDTVRVADIIARDGARVPEAGVAPQQIRVASIVLSRNSLLSSSEMAFFEYLAVRGESEVPVFTSDGLSRVLSSPFHPATGGRASLSARLRIGAQ